MIWDAKRLAVAATLILIAIGSWWLTRSVTVPEIRFDGKQRHDPDYIIEKFHATVLDVRGNPRYELSATRLVHYGDDGSSDLDQPYLIQYAPGAAPVHTRADRGWMPERRDQIVMRGNAVSSQGRDPRSGGGEVRVDEMKILLDR